MEEKRNAIDLKYNDIVRKKFNIDPYGVRDIISTTEKNESYFARLNVFKWLFVQSKEAQIYLWNQFYYIISSYTLAKVDKNDFSAEEWQFLKSIEKAHLNYLNTEKKYDEDVSFGNINGKIETDRLILTPFNEELNDKCNNFFMQYKEEYERFYGNELNEEVIRFDYSGRLHFAILLKETKEFVGFTKLDDYVDNDALCDLECYIMPNHRQKGYAHETVQRLIDEAFHDGLVILEEDIREGVFTEVRPQIRCIAAQIDTNDEISIKFIEKLGFKRDGILRFQRRLRGNYLHYYVYTLEKTS